MDVDATCLVSDPSERGRILERAVCAMLSSGHGLRIVDVRHRNDYEEIDIIVAITRYSPMLSHRGPAPFD